MLWAASVRPGCGAAGGTGTSIRCFDGKLKYFSDSTSYRKQRQCKWEDIAAPGMEVKSLLLHMHNRKRVVPSLEFWPLYSCQGRR